MRVRVLRKSAVCVCVFIMFLGTLYFANVLPSDAHDEHKYVCIAYNLILGAHVQGNDQKVEPSELGGW
jgi:hypothetical protein